MAEIVVRVRGRFAVTPDATYTIRDGGLVVKDPSDVVYLCMDWDAEHLPAGVTISDSVFTVQALDVDDGSPAAALTAAEEDIFAERRKTQAEFSGGTVGALYRVNNAIVRSDGQARERSFLVRVEQQ